MKINALLTRYPQLTPLSSQIETALGTLSQTVEKGGKILTCGNGGSASDAEHIVGELVKSFAMRRPLPAKDVQLIEKTFPNESSHILANLEGAIPAVCLMSNVSISTAFANDKSYEFAAAQQLYALGSANDTLIAISTSGNSKNVLAACKIAKIKNIKTIGLTGASGGKLKDLCDTCIQVPSDKVHEIQEMHLPIYHFLCAALEARIFNSDNNT
ncbi:MAG: SIS domain-containing protein [Oligoflexales bacterium]